MKQHKVEIKEQDKEFIRKLLVCTEDNIGELWCDLRSRTYTEQRNILLGLRNFFRFVNNLIEEKYKNLYNSFTGYNDKRYTREIVNYFIDRDGYILPKYDGMVDMTEFFEKEICKIEGITYDKA